MSISRNRFELALQQLKSSQWEEFEFLASAFLAAEFPNVRTTAHPGGDKGRDAELFAGDGAPAAMFQFSVRSDWKQKILDSLKTLATNFPAVTHIVFLTNQLIGAAGDPLKAMAAASGRSLDIRDRSWFLERMDVDDARRNASRRLAQLVVDPFLETSGVTTNAPGLTGQQARTALVYLEMQSRDDVAEKGLTKLSYEALVRCVLKGTDNANRKTRIEIRREIGALLPQHSSQQLQPFIDAALSRLNKRAIRHHSKTDEFHLSFEEMESTKDKVAGLVILNDAFTADVEDILARDENVPTTRYGEIVQLVRMAIEVYFYKLGEEFAQSLTKDMVPPVHSDLIDNVCTEISPVGNVYPGRPWTNFLKHVTRLILNTPSDATTELLRLLSTSYTLFAFLSEVPDVQRATKKLFERGTIWLDTSVLLPVLAELAYPEDLRPFTTLMKNLSRAGTTLVVTEGVLEELERHLNLCLTYTRAHDWEGRVPYVFSRYVESGRSLASFPSWLENIVGQHRPLDDIADFLAEVGIQVSNAPSFGELDRDMVRAVREYWQEVQEKRRSEEYFSATAYRMAEHDSENYLAALAQRRRAPGASVLGYSSWFLTMDSAAWSLFDRIDQETRQKIKHAPVISLDFLLKYLAFGPRRDQIDNSGKGFSRIFTSSIYESIPSELIEVAEQVRKESVGLPERIIQRRIRDELDRQKMTAGDAQRAGLH